MSILDKAKGSGNGSRGKRPGNWRVPRSTSWKKLASRPGSWRTKPALRFAEGVSTTVEKARSWRARRGRGQGDRQRNRQRDRGRQRQGVHRGKSRRRMPRKPEIAAMGKTRATATRAERGKTGSGAGQPSLSRLKKPSCSAINEKTWFRFREAGSSARTADRRGCPRTA